MSDPELRALVRRETEILNAPVVLHAGRLLMPGPENIGLSPGLEFVEFERCIHLFHEVLKQSLAWSQLAPTFESLDEAEYASFLGEAAKSFRDELERVAP